MPIFEIDFAVKMLGRVTVKADKLDQAIEFVKNGAGDLTEMLTNYLQEEESFFDAESVELSWADPDQDVEPDYDLADYEDNESS